MLIDLSKTREEYFVEPDIHAILSRVAPGKSRITDKVVRDAYEQGLVVVGTPEGTLEGVLNQEHTIDSLQLVSTIKNLKSDQVLLLPPKYRIDAPRVREVVVLSLERLVKLDSVAVKRRVLGTHDVPEGPLSGRQKVEYRWDPRHVVQAAFTLLHENKEKLAEKIFSSYSWIGADDHRRVVPLYRAVQGAELHAFSYYAKLKLLPPQLRWELMNGKERSTSRSLSLAEIAQKRLQLRSYETIIERYKLQPILERLDVRPEDMITLMSQPFNNLTGWHLQVPSRTQSEQLYEPTQGASHYVKGKKRPRQYDVRLTSVPVVDIGSDDAYRLVWNLRAATHSRDQLFRSARMRADPHRGQDSDFFDALGIAAAHSVRSFIDAGSQKELPFLPFVIPTAETSEYARKLVHQAFILDPVPTGDEVKWQRRALNKTEVENLLWKKVLVDGYDATFSTDARLLYPQGDKPRTALIRFSG